MTISKEVQGTPVAEFVKKGEQENMVSYLNTTLSSVNNWCKHIAENGGKIVYEVKYDDKLIPHVSVEVTFVEAK